MAGCNAVTFDLTKRELSCYDGHNTKEIMHMNQIRKYIVFYGIVQGVGFRYRACHAADAVGATD